MSTEPVHETFVKNDFMEVISRQNNCIRHYDTGAVIIKEGDASVEFYIILKGKVNVVKNLGLRSESHIVTLGELEVLGEMAYFDNKRRSASGVASTETELLVLDNESFAKIEQEYPDFVNVIIRSIAARIYSAYQSNLK